MNLKPAEQWVDESRNPNVVVGPAMRDLEIERTRKIQADALWTAYAIVSETQPAAFAQREIARLANSLDEPPATP